MKRSEAVNKKLDKLFKDTRKRIGDSTQNPLNNKINKSIKNRKILKNLALIIITIIGAAIFSYFLSLIIP